ncbi:MAG: PAS domain S-box protein [Thermodesulfobacteriota bacterium]
MTDEEREKGLPQKGARLLVAAPDSAQTADLVKRLDHIGYDVAALFHTGSGAIAACETSDFDLALIDTALEGPPDGSETAERLHFLFDMPSVPIHPAESENSIPSQSLCMPYGYLVRPFSDQSLSMVIEQILYTSALKKSRKAAETECREAKSRYRLLADNVRDIIFTMDLDLNYTYISPSIEKIRGYTPEEVVGRNFAEMTAPETAQKARSIVAEELEIEDSRGVDSGRFRIIETELFCKDGSTVWTEAKFSFIRDQFNQPVGVIGVNRDITERKQIDNQLKESEEKFRTLAEACPFAIMIYQDDYWVYANPAAEQISGYSRQELYGMRFWEIVHPADQGLVRNRGSQRQSGRNAPPSYDFRIVNKSGELRWTSLTGASFIYQGQPAGLITVIDITQRKQAEEDLRKSEEKYRNIIETIEDGYYEVDLAGNFTLFNEMVCRLSGYNEEEMKGVNYRQYTDEANAQKLYEVFNTVYRTGKSASALDVEIIRRDASRRFIEISASLVKDAAQQVVGFRGIIRDVTERRQAEEQNQRLEAQLQHAQKMEAIGTLAGGIAHDFNNILQAINGYTQLLLMRKGEDHPDYKKLVQLQNSGDRAARLIDQLLTFSRKMEGQRRSLSLNHEVGLVHKILKQTVPRMIAIEQDLDDDLWPVHADPVHIEQILLNLGSNAADAMPDGGTLTIETRNVVLDQQYCDDHLGATPGKYVVLSVTDTGCGMDANTVEQIYDPFFTTKDIGKGTGLGLASVYGIVKSHNGYIMCYSELGQGTIFKIYLPAMSPQQDSEVHNAGEKEFAGGTESILVVDDEVPIRDAAMEMLSHYGYAVQCAEDAESALELYRSQSGDIDLVILDLSMPGLGGHQCLRELLKIDPAAKVLIASGYATNGHARQARADGAAGFIGKPYQMQELTNKVRAVLDESGDKG